MEPEENIVFRCAKHRSHPDQQFFDKPFEWFLGKFCKLAFPTGLAEMQNELMWVRVEHVENIGGKLMLVGRLDNDPFYGSVRQGDRVEFDREEIHAVMG